MANANDGSGNGNGNGDSTVSICELYTLSIIIDSRICKKSQKLELTFSSESQFGPSPRHQRHQTTQIVIPKQKVEARSHYTEPLIAVLKTKIGARPCDLKCPMERLRPQ
ncbi:uncharacterized protein LOC143913581 [Arctopsyche grandis]|uniref:uncharacterized protein LOC143913581 n=1 Tax=Arctopsyche grandis TaxID=121162 RepID=UPI00406D6EEB